MTSIRVTPFFLMALLFTVLPARGEGVTVEVQAVLGKTAVLVVNGQQETLRIGESSSGVTLLATDPKGVKLDINGNTQSVGLSQRIGTSFEAPRETVVTIARNPLMQYQTNVKINGSSGLAMVDTGANIVAISSAQARQMNIDYSSGTPSQVETASGITPAYAITLRSVSVGGIEVNNVRATVVKGDYPGTILLGMSYLQHVKMEEHEGILSLSRSQ